MKRIVSIKQEQLLCLALTKQRKRIAFFNFDKNLEDAKPKCSSNYNSNFQYQPTLQLRNNATVF